jgi:hypothetical protein
MTGRVAAVAAVAVGFLLAGCADRPPAVSGPPVTPVPAVTTVSCPGLQVDPGATLGPAFDEEVFVADEQETIGRTFVDELSRLYAGDADADPCRLFTGRGLTRAAAADPRLATSLAGMSRTEGDLVFRRAIEGTYDLRQRPPTVPLDVVFDIPAGSVTTDPSTGTSSTSTAARRVALRVTFRYDGHRWLADDAQPVPPADAAGLALPTPITVDRACSRLRRDASGAGFDDNAGFGVGRDEQRPWCTLGGAGVQLTGDQVSLGTRFPCNQGRIADLHLGHPLGLPFDPLVTYEYVRDPNGEALAQGWAAEPWRAGVEVPPDAAETGWTNGNMDVWISPSEEERAIYVKVGGLFERWPRGDHVVVTDCN